MHGTHHFILAASFTSHVHVYCMHYYSKSQKKFLSTCYWTGAYLLAAVHLHALNNTSHVARRHFTEQKNSSALGPKSIHALKDGSGWLNIRIIRIHIRLKCKYEYPYSYLILIWMSYGCIRIWLWELFSIRFQIRIREISDHIRIRTYPQSKSG